jgi:hypothetical protein
MSNNPAAKARAEKLFKSEQRLVEGAKAMNEYQQHAVEVRKRTETLRALRLKRDSEEPAPATKPKA